jgi:hypothetical protein
MQDIKVKLYSDLRHKSGIQQEGRFFFSPKNLSVAETWKLRKIYQKYLEGCWRRMEVGPIV